MSENSGNNIDTTTQNEERSVDSFENIKLGTETITSMYLGDNQIVGIYIGDTLLYKVNQ